MEKIERELKRDLKKATGKPELEPTPEEQRAGARAAVKVRWTKGGDEAMLVCELRRIHKELYRMASTILDRTPREVQQQIYQACHDLNDLLR